MAICGQKTMTIQRFNDALLEIKRCSHYKNPTWIINKELAIKQGLDNIRLLQIANIYRKKLKIERCMKRYYEQYLKYEAPYKRKELKTLHKEWQHLEYCLQALWRFELDSRYHKDYLLPGCTCPKMDNDDIYPIQRLVNADCILHGVQE